MATKAPRIKLPEPDNIPPGYLWCNDATHEGENPFSGERSVFFAANRKQCKTCYNRYQRNRNKPIPLIDDVASLNDLSPSITSKLPENLKIPVRAGMPTPKLVDTGSGSISDRMIILENKLKTLQEKYDKLVNEFEILKSKLG